MEEFTAGEVRTHNFRVVLRGFDQRAVRDYLEQVAEYLEAVQQQLHQAGVTELASPLDLAAEYSAAGEEVTRVLAEARAAADVMRSRAAAETAQWRSDAEAETMEARESAWEAGSEMLEQVTAQCEALLIEARDTALRLRSDAERESSRMLTDAQREREELARAGRDEAEKTVTAARKEADSLLMAARQQADVAQERTRALEDRRTELMDELESAQKALLGIEDESESAPAETPDEQEEPSAEEAESTRSQWPDNDPAVRIVAVRPKVRNESVDADALAAEVEAMRASPPEPPDPSPAVIEEAKEREPAPQPPPPKGEETEEPKPEPVDEEPEPEPEQETEPQTESGPDQLAGLFDELRAPEEVSPESPNGQPEPTAGAVVTEERTSDNEDALDSRLSTPDSSTDPFALRDRLLLPVQNRALRLVKRQLVAAQNVALEELRLDPDWTPSPGLVNGEIAGVLVELVEESAAAGAAAAAELLGRADAAQPELHPADPSTEFTGGFIDAVALSLERSRSAGAGKRETSSSLSRVFRAWRTDDADRRVRLMSRRAYHEGLMAALQAMNCDRVAIDLFDKACVDHTDASGSWLIAEGPPAGVLVPPASLECSCAVVPEC